MDTAVTIAIIGLVGSLLTVAVGLLTIREQRKKLQAEAETLHKQAATVAKQTDMDCAMQMINQLQEDNTRLREQMAGKDAEFSLLQREVFAMRTEVSELRIGITILITQIRDLGEEPNWEPRQRTAGD